MRNLDEVVPWSMAAVKDPLFLGRTSAAPSMNSDDWAEPMLIRLERFGGLKEENMPDRRESGRGVGGAKRRQAIGFWEHTTALRRILLNGILKEEKEARR